jgi:DNA-directed RNA polymerase subunit RPC12/RpoP
MTSNEFPSEEFKYDENGELVCAKCGSKHIVLVPKMFFMYYMCKDCGNEERF